MRLHWVKFLKRWILHCNSISTVVVFGTGNSKNNTIQPALRINTGHIRERSLTSKLHWLVWQPSNDYWSCYEWVCISCSISISILMKIEAESIITKEETLVTIWVIIGHLHYLRIFHFDSTQCQIVLFWLLRHLSFQLISTFNHYF